MTTKATASGSPELHTEYDEYMEDSIDLQSYLKSVRKHRWPILATTVLLTGIVALVVSGLTPSYRATATMLIETRQAVPVNLDKIIGIDTENKQYYQTQLEVLKSKRLAQRVVSEMGLYEHPELSPPETRIDGESSTNTEVLPTFLTAEELEQRKAIERFIKRTSILPVKNTNMVHVRFESADPVFAARVANKIVDTYIVSYTDSRTEMGEQASITINKRLDELRIELEQSQRRLLDYKEINGLVDIQGDSDRLSEQEIGIITNKLLDAESEASYAKLLYEEVTKAEKLGVDVLLSLPSIDSNPMVRSNKLSLQETKLQLDELKNRYGDKHPRVIDATSRQSTALNNLYSEVENIVDSIEKNYVLTQQTAASLRTKLESGKKRIQQSDRSNLELLHLEREVQLNRELYDTFYTRSREVDEAENINASNALVTEYAEAPLHPVSPKKQLITLLALLLSAAASVLVAALYEASKQGISSTDDVELNLGTKMLGILPLASTKTRRKAKSNALIPGTLQSDSHAFEESVRTIRTSICVDELQQSQQIIMVTSALPSEGKSTLASQLAYSFSSIERALLIECDLRRPSLHRAFNFSNTDGLTQLLAGEVAFSQCIQTDCIGNLDVIPAGSISASPLDLLTSKRFNRLIGLMRQRYDRIIIDSAPVQAVSDALILGQFADSVLYTVKENSTSTKIANRGVCRLVDAGITVTGVVVSQVKLKKSSSAGELNYEGFYDYYGYSERPDSELGIKNQKAA